VFYVKKQSKENITYYEGLLLLPEPLLAEEDDGALEHEAHGVQLKALQLKSIK
jgi:hypothetical protein